MQRSIAIWRSICILSGPCLALLFAVLFLLPLQQVHAQAKSVHSSSRNIQQHSPAAAPPVRIEHLEVGTSAAVKLDSWVPVLITVGNHQKKAFMGSVTISTYYYGIHIEARFSAPQIFTQAISVAPGTQQKITMYLPFNAGQVVPPGLMANLMDSKGQSLDVQYTDVDLLNLSDISIAVLSEHATGFTTLSNLLLPGHTTSPKVSFLAAASFPTVTTVLNSFDAIILDDFSTDSLQPAQLLALQTWVNQGGILLEIGGADWQRTLAPLPSELLPVHITGTFELPIVPHLLSSSGVFPPPAPNQRMLNDTLPTVVTVSDALAQTQETPEQVYGDTYTGAAIIGYGSTPLLVQKHVGQGRICYLAFDPAAPALAKWSGLATLWRQVLIRAFGNRLLVSDQLTYYDGGQGGLLARGGFLAALQPSLAFVPQTFLLLIISYLFILGPVRLLITRWLKQLFWNWRIILSSIIVFSLLSFGVTFYQHRSSLSLNTLSLIQMNQDGDASHITTYMGVFVPNEDNFKIHIPQQRLLQAVINPLSTNSISQTNGDISTPITYTPNATNVTMLDADIWSYHPFVFEEDRQMHGRLVTDLKLEEKRIVGTITNTLPTALSDVYVLIPHGFIALNHLNAGETRTINEPLVLASGDTSLADLIAQNSGLPASYFPYQNEGQPLSTFQRHIAQLSILSGVGSNFIPCSGTCMSHAIVNVNKHTIVTSHADPGKVPLPVGNDPLLLNGAQATVIAWADHALDGTNDITVNGTVAQGFHDNLIQEPVSLRVDAPVNIPDNFITGQLVNAQSNDTNATTAMVLPDVYSMVKSSLDFEFTWPQGLGVPISALTITLPHAFNGLTMLNKNLLTTSLYNWQTASWDQVSLTGETIVTRLPEIYINTNGRILLHISTKNISQNAFYISTPWLKLS